MKILKKITFDLINYSIKLSKNKNSLRFLGILSFLESVIVPIPPDIFLLPIVLKKKNKWFYFGLYCTFFSILGGILGYLIGFLFWDVVGNTIISFYEAQNKISLLQEQFSKYGWFIIIIAGFTPIPYKVFTIGSGLLGFNFFIFLVCSIFSRGLRFITLAYLVSKYGERSLKIVDKYFFSLSLILVFILIIIFIMFYI